MTKTYCDFCGKEIKGKSDNYEVTIKRNCGCISELTGFITIKYDICDKCLSLLQKKKLKELSKNP